MADNGRAYRCHKCDDDYANGTVLASHFAECPSHRTPRQQQRFENAQKVTKRRRSQGGIKRSSMYGRVRKRKGGPKRAKPTYWCHECKRNLGSAAHSFNHFQQFPHHRNEKQLTDYNANLVISGRKPNGGLPTIPKATRTRKKAPAIELALSFCTACGTHRMSEHHFCGGCGVQL
jgi:hypothetical protein